MNGVRWAALSLAVVAVVAVGFLVLPRRGSEDGRPVEPPQITIPDVKSPTPEPGVPQPAPPTRPRTAPDDAALRVGRERDASEFWRQAREAAQAENWEGAKELLDTLDAQYATTQCCATHAAAIAELRGQVAEESRYKIEKDVTVLRPDADPWTWPRLPGEWVHIAAKGIQHPYWAGTRLRFEQRGAQVFLSVDGAPARLAGILLSEPEGSAGLRQAIADGATALTVWCTRDQLAQLPPFPEQGELCVQVTDTRVPDLEPLSGLRSLVALHVNGHGATDLSALAKHTRLRSLHLGSSPKLTDLSAVANFPELTYFHANAIGVRSIAPFEKLTNLTTLKVVGANLPDFNGVANLKRLREIELSSHSSTCDISALENLPQLRWLTMRFVRPTGGIRTLAKLTRLTELRCSLGPDDTSLAPLAGLTRLTILEVSAPRVSDLSPLSALTRLTFLQLDGIGQVSDLSPLAGMSQLAVLKIWAMDSVADITPLGRLTSLRTLNLLRTKGLTDLGPVANLAGLNQFSVYGPSELSDLRPLAKLKNAETLSLSTLGKLVDLGPVEEMKNLVVINLRECPRVTDLSPLAKLPRLRYLNLDACGGVTDLAPLAGLVKRGCQIRAGLQLQDEIRKLKPTDF
ncbi:MAG: hypothetical protein FJ290_29100 [Planctomycetes bacterium]|nr:hypothetical protein [Planctomycetota bacterium]